MASHKFAPVRQTVFVRILCLLAFTASLGLVLIPSTVSAQVTINLTADKDNTLYEDPAGSVSNGAGQYFFAGRTDKNFLRRAVLRFDLSSIPSGSTVSSVTLTLTMSRTQAVAEDVSLHPLLADWGEGTSNPGGQEGEGNPSTTDDATWIHTFYPGPTWTTPGGDYGGVASATALVSGNGPYTWSSPGMVLDAQDWLDNPSNNFGWIVIGDEATQKSAKRFNSRENSGNWPNLEITYTSTDTTGACCLSDDSCVVVGISECATLGGTYQGNGAPCTPDPCSVVTGACCFDDGSCTELTALDCANQAGIYQGDGTNCQTTGCPLVLEPYVDALPIPAVATPVSGTIGGAATYEMTMTQFKQKLHRDLDSTTVWGYDGAHPGPTIVASVNEPVQVEWINDLRDSTGALRTNHFLPVDTCMHGPDTEGDTPRTVVHLHGGHVMQEDDGYPEDTFLPGFSDTYFYPNKQLPATLWYHDHALGITRLNVIMGMAGFYLLLDDFENNLNLPGGEYQIGLALQDRSFKANGEFDYPAAWQDIFFGDKILVNGMVWPFLEVKRGKYRFRILNGSNSRAYSLRLSTGDPIWVIGDEGGLLGAPVPVDTLTVTTGERFDVVIDFDLYGPNTEVLLANSAPAPFPGPPGEGVVPDVMKFIVQGGSKGFTDPLPTTLRPVVALPESTSVEDRDFVLQKGDDPCTGAIWEINGMHWNDITELPVLDTTEIWRFINRSGMAHPMHMHLVMFQILDRQAFTVVGDDSIVAVGDPIPPEPHMAGWKDTVPVMPGEMVRVIAKFEDYTGLFAYHCHILEHEDHEMMRQFQVVWPVGVTQRPIPFGLFLSQNQPNPFSTHTSISFGLPSENQVSLRVFDIAGREVRRLVDGQLPGTVHHVTWDGLNNSGQRVGAGVYMLRLLAGEEKLVKKMVLVR